MARYQSLFFNGASSASDVVTLSGKNNKDVGTMVRNGRHPICLLGADNYIVISSKNNVGDVLSQFLYPSFRFGDTTETMS
jgi:hypothetical protein